MNSNVMNPVDRRPPIIADIVYRRIHQAITNSDLEPGTLLTEQGLADQLNVSKTPVREAFLRLRQVGLIEPEGKRGLRVVKLTSDGLRQVLEIREALEVFLAARSAERADHARKRAIMAAAKASLRAAEAGNMLAFHEHDKIFHTEIAATAENPQMLDQINNAIAQVQTAVSRQDLPDLDELVGCAKAHVRIAKAIETGSEDMAAREMSLHLRKIHELIVAGKLSKSSRAEMVI